MTEATLLKANSTPETLKVNDNATSATRTIRKLKQNDAV